MRALRTARPTVGIKSANMARSVSSSSVMGSDCGPCPGDCCPLYGDGICEWPEDGSKFPDQACPEDCSGAAVPVCESFKWRIRWLWLDVSLRRRADVREDDQCIPGTGTGSDTSDSCFNSLDCADDKPPTHCIDGKCEPCPPKCASEPCDADDCAGCGQCADGLACKDNGECGPTQN